MKKCSKCKLEKDYNEFGKDKYAKDGLNYRCKNCVNIEKQNKPKKKIEFICDNCKQKFLLDYYKCIKRKTPYCTFCQTKVNQSGIKRPEVTGSKSKRWSGGEYVNSAGYKMIKCDGEYNISGRTKYRPEHILIYEKHIGRKLNTENVNLGGIGEQIHHIDGDKTNNNIDNLLLCSNNKDHKRIDCQLHKIAFDAVKLGIIKFDKNNREYYLDKEYLK